MAGNIKVGGHTVFTHTGPSGAGTLSVQGQNGNVLLSDDGTAVSLGNNVRLPTSGGIKDSSGNNILTESGGNVSVGNVRLPTTGGIKDSAGNNVLSASNSVVTLNNITIGDSISFSQGTWTPTFTDNAGIDLVTTYGNRYATYTRIGNIVFFNCDIENNSYSGSSTSQLYLSGLPTFGVSFGQSNVEYNGYYGGIVSYYAGLQAFSSSYSIHWILQNSGLINFYYAGGANSNHFQQNYLTSSSRFIFEGRYYLEAIT